MTNDQLTTSVHKEAAHRTSRARTERPARDRNTINRYVGVVAERSRDTTVFREAPPKRSASLTTSQLQSVQRVWQTAGFPAVSGYAATFLAMAVASDPTIAATLTSVDFDDVDSVTNAVEQLTRWREQAFRATPVA
jgi:hypothetical protein